VDEDPERGGREHLAQQGRGGGDGGPGGHERLLTEAYRRDASMLRVNPDHVLTRVKKTRIQLHAAWIEALTQTWKPA